MKAPSFWYRSPGLLSFLLWPLGWFYGKVSGAYRSYVPLQRFSLPIISIGNLVAGGAGKTPTALALARLLEEKGIHVHFVTRGYGGKERGPLRVDPLKHTAGDVGDEPLLLAQQAPTWVAKKRPLGIQKAFESGANLVILDDGHQTPGCFKDISFVVIDELQGFGNGCVIPAGPLREFSSHGIKRADGFIGIGHKNHQDVSPFFKAQLYPEDPPRLSQPVFAFCGLGFPDKFYRSLKEAGILLVGTESFPDHYVYTKEDLVTLQERAKALGACLITTRKDKVKIPDSWQIPCNVLDITIQFEDSEGIYRFILDQIPSLKEITFAKTLKKDTPYPRV